MFIHTYSMFDFFIARVQLQNAPLLLPHEPENFYSLQNEEFTAKSPEAIGQRTIKNKKKTRNPIRTHAHAVHLHNCIL